MMEQVISLLETNGVTDYQVTDKVIASSSLGSPRFDTAVWPGYNVNITMQIKEDADASAILDLLRKFNKENASSKDELLTVCSWNTDDYFFD